MVHAAADFPCLTVRGSIMAAHGKHREHSEQPQGPGTQAVGFAERDSIARHASELFQQRVREMGRDLDDWLRAEHELMEAGSRTQSE